MKRLATIALITGIAATANAKPKPPTCEKTSERFSARQAQWETFSSKSFTDALAREQLTIPKGHLDELEPMSPLLKGMRPGATFAMGTGANATTAVYLRTVQTYGQPTDEFVEDAQSVIHPLERKEHLVGSESHLMCGCGPMGGGAVPPMRAVIYILPSGATYDPKPIELAYDAKHIEVRWDFRVNGQMCQPPP